MFLGRTFFPFCEQHFKCTDHIFSCISRADNGVNISSCCCRGNRVLKFSVLSCFLSKSCCVIADNGQFFEVKADYGKSVAVGFIRLNSATVGAVANRRESYDAEGKKVWESDGTLSARGARKAAEFVKFCDAFEIPVLTLTNVNGFKATVCGEKN